MTKKTKYEPLSWIFYGQISKQLIANVNKKQEYYKVNRPADGRPKFNAKNKNKIAAASKYDYRQHEILSESSHVKNTVREQPFVLPTSDLEIDKDGGMTGGAGQVGNYIFGNDWFDLDVSKRKQLLLKFMFGSYDLEQREVKEVDKNITKLLWTWVQRIIAPYYNQKKYEDIVDSRMMELHDIFTSFVIDASAILDKSWFMASQMNASEEIKVKEAQKYFERFWPILFNGDIEYDGFFSREFFEIVSPDFVDRFKKELFTTVDGNDTRFHLRDFNEDVILNLFEEELPRIKSIQKNLVNKTKGVNRNISSTFYNNVDISPQARMDMQWAVIQTYLSKSGPKNYNLFGNRYQMDWDKRDKMD